MVGFIYKDEDILSRFSLLRDSVFKVQCDNHKLNYGGAKGDRTPDLLRARQALSQLSYSPIVVRLSLLSLNGGP